MISFGRALAAAFERVGWAGAQPWLRLRLAGVGAFFGLLFVLLGYRAFVLQIREGEKLRALGEEQYRDEVEIPARRGRILDRNGKELAASVEVDSISANPRQLQGLGAVERTARALGRALSLDPRELEKKLRAHRFSTWVKRRVSPEEARAVRDLGLPGVFLQREPRRFYPNRTLAGALLGWAGVDGRGLEGIELAADEWLRGARAAVPGLRDALGRHLFVEGGESAAESGGADVETTIDKFIQFRLESALEAGVAKNHAKAGVALALDPRSGEVLAMASVPTLNPNDPGAVERGARNRAVTDPFEPGSTMKTFSIAAAIEARLVHPDEPWNCENGRWQVGRAVIHDAEPSKTLTTTEVLARSSNICTAKIARKSGRERVADMLARFHFGAPTQIDLPGERGGLLRKVSRWGEIELATISFGQGMTATPLQVAAGYAAIANGGTWFRPHVTRRVRDVEGHVLFEAKPEGHRVLDEATVRTMQRMLFAVTQKGGTADKLAIPGYPAAGKTGTAQKVDPSTRRYSTDHWASSFVGYAPLDAPRLVIFVMVDEPSGEHFGSAVAGPIWHDVMADALRYMNVPPVAEELAAAAAPNNNKKREAAEPPAAVREGPANGDATAKGYLDADEDLDAGEVPDFRGLSLAEALELARRAGLALEVAGTGLAVSQEPSPGAQATAGRCKVTFAPPG